MSWFHKHAWKATGVTPLNRGNAYKSDVICPITEVLMVCDCGDIKTVCLDGTWTLEQLQPKSGPVADAEFFRKIGVKL